MPGPSLRALEWDSALFGRKMGVLEVDAGAHADVERGLDAARREGYAYLICRPAVDDAAVIAALGAARFYLSDAGVTWTTETAARRAGWTLPTDAGIVQAQERDVPALQDLIRMMFPDSRFYTDRFFSTDEAELLHREWIKNSVTGQAADLVLWKPNEGFVTLKRRGSTGEIVLIGVKERLRRQGLGAQLLAAAMAHFVSNGVTRVDVRTQLRNLRASNFYQAHGFSLGRADVTFSRIVSEFR